MAADEDTVTWDRDDFPRWALDMRRFESIFLGAIPFALLFINLGYNSYADAYGAPYVPWVANQSLSSSEKEAYSKIYIGVSVAAVIAIADMIVFKIKKHRSR